MAVALDEDTPFDEVNAWLRSNRHLLRPLAGQYIDIGHFYDEHDSAPEGRIDRNGQLPRRITALPMVVWCSPRNARHDVRVKVSPVHGDRMPEDDAISIAVRPAPHYPRSEQRRLSPEDFRLVSVWLVREEPIIVDYWNMMIDTNEFRQRIAANEAPG